MGQQQDQEPSEKDLMQQKAFAGADSLDAVLDDTSNDDFGHTPQPAEPESGGQQQTAGTQEAASGQQQTEGADDNSGSGEQADETGGQASTQTASETGGQGEGEGEHRIPKSRFDEVNRRRKEAERRLQELERQQQAQDPEQAASVDLDAKEREYMEAVLNGETDKALSIRKEIRQAEQAIHEAKVQQAQQEATHKTKAQLELEQSIQQLQQQYPEFDASSERFNQEATDEALELFQALQGRGYTPADAMNRAVRYTVSAHQLSGTQQQPAQQQAQQGGQQQGQQQGGQQQASVDRKLEAAQQQPPDPGLSREPESPQKDPMRMSEAEFDALNPEEEKKLRGDFV